jgi:putative endonuclease
MAEHNELGKWKKWLSNFYEKTAILSYKPTTLFRKQKLIFLPKENTLAVVEVKTRSSLNLDCLKIFKPKKNQLLVKAVDAFVNERDLDIEVRFDISHQ